MKRRLFAFAFALISLCLPVAAHAGTVAFGRDDGYGYFTNEPYTNTEAFFSTGTNPLTATDGLGPTCESVCSLTNFENIYQARLYDPTSIGDRARAAGEIDIMLGQPGTVFDGSVEAGIDYAQANFTNWENLMALYASGTVPGYSVQWNAIYDFSGTTLPFWSAAGADLTPSETPTDCTVPGPCSGDLAISASTLGSTIEPVVEFNVNGQLLLIRQYCGCMSGTTQSLAMSGSTITLTKSSSVPSLPVGSTMTYSIVASEEPNIPLQNVTISDPVPAQFTPIPGSCLPVTCTITGNTVTWTFAAPGDSAILNNIASGSETLTVGVTAVTAGNNISNTAIGTATDNLGNNVTVNPGSTQTTITAPAQSPSFIGENGDIHAGGGLCDAPLGPAMGYVKGSPNTTSQDQYVVSSATSIADFGSNAAASGSVGDTLKLGANGQYSQVCRPDLVTAAISGRTGVNQGTIPAAPGPFTTVDVGCLSTPAAACGPGLTGGFGTYYFDGGDLHLSGVVNHKITIVATAGSMDITGPITLTSTPAAANATPSLGLISATDIDIDAGVTQVDAYLFANGTIDTCGEADGTCDTTLTLNGFMMAQQLLLHRFGTVASPVGEDIVMTPQIYLNPPAFFDTSVDNTGLAGQGEQPPLF